MSEKTAVKAFGKYKVEIVILQNGENEHSFRRIDEFPYQIKVNDKSYEITSDALFEIETSTLKKIKNIVFLIRREYMIIFRESETEPLIRFDSEVSPRVLKVARTSTAVKGMIKEWFSGGRLPINKWAFILIVALVGTAIYAKMNGYF